MYQPVKLSWAKHALATPTTFAYFFQPLFAGLLLCGILAGLLPSRLSAQATVEVPLSQFFHSVSVAGGTLNANQAGTVTLNLGSSDAPVSDALGLRLELVLSQDAVLPTNPLSVSVNGSWLLANVTYSQSLEVDGVARKMYLTLERDPDEGFVSGHGFALSFPLVSANNGVSASSLVTAEGGVVIIENVDMKMAAVGVQVAESEEWVLYPNPCKDQVRVRLPGDAPADLRLMGMDGVTHGVAMQVEGGLGVADLVPVRRGIYWAEVWQAGKLVARERIVVGNEQ